MILCSSTEKTSSSSLQIGCDALSNPSPASTTKANSNQKSKINSSIRIQLANVANPSELEALQDCRRTAFDPNKLNWMNSERDFVKAQSVLDEKHLCVIAVASDDTVMKKNQMQIVGSADLYPNAKGKNTVMNVFVRPDQRGKGIGRKLMVDGIEQVLVPLLEEPNAQQQQQMSGSSSSSNTTNDDDNNPAAITKEAVLSLDVYTQNKAAIELYLKLGYEPASPMHAGTLGLAKALQANFVVTLSKKVAVVR